MFTRYVYPVATMAGGIIGVGFLSLPYITLQVGVWPMLACFLLVGGLVMCIHLMFAQVSLKTPDYKRFPGFVGFYLGKPAEVCAHVLNIAGSFGVLLAYLLVGSQFLAAIASPWLGGGGVWYMVAYFIFVSAMVFFGIRAIGKIEFWALTFLVALLAAIGVYAFFRLPLHLPVSFNKPFTFTGIWLPYGAIIFSLWGIGMIPQVEEVLPEKRHLQGTVAFSMALVAVFYIAFIMLILAISGAGTTQMAITGFQYLLDLRIFYLAAAMGLVVTVTAFVAQGTLLQETFAYDLGVAKPVAWAITCGAPWLLFFLGAQSFLHLISLVGTFILPVDALLVLCMYRKIGGSFKVVYPLAGVFLLGTLYTMFHPFL